MKERFRKSIQKTISYFSNKSYFGVIKNGAILFPRWNMTLSNPINNALKNDMRVFFVDGSGVLFDWRNLIEDKITDEKFLESFLQLENNARNFLYRNKVDYFVVDRFTRNSLDLHAYLLACKQANTKTVYLDHGETGSIHPNIPFDRLLNWDYVYLTNTDMKKYYEKEKEKYGLKTEIKEWARTRQPRKEVKVKKNMILFAPQFIEADRFDQLFPQTLQYKHREKLLNIFDDIVRNIGVEVIWKTYEPGNLLYDPIKDLCEDKQVHYCDTNNFDGYLSKATMFITDCISTTLYDAIEDGVPSLVLRYRKAAETRESILKQFGDVIFIYDSIKEAEEKLEEFIFDCLGLNGEEEKYLPELEFNPEPFPWEE